MFTSLHFFKNNYISYIFLRPNVLPYYMYILIIWNYFLNAKSTRICAKLWVKFQGPTPIHTAVGWSMGVWVTVLYTYRDYSVCSVVKQMKRKGLIIKSLLHAVSRTHQGGRGNLVLKHTVPHFLVWNFGAVVGRRALLRLYSVSIQFAPD